MNFIKLLSKITSVPKVSDKISLHLARLKISRIIDVLLHIPSKLNQIKIDPPYLSINSGDNVSLEVSLDELPVDRRFAPKKASFRIICSYENKPISLVFFNYYPNYIIPKLTAQKTFRISGKVEKYLGQISIAHPKFIFNFNRPSTCFEPVYPLTYGLVSEQISNFAKYALSLIKPEDDLLNKEIISSLQLPSIYTCFEKIHHPETLSAIDPTSPYIRRLAFDELLAHQLAINLLRNNNIRNNGIAFINDGKLVEKILASLPFTLTNNQQQAIAEIFADQNSSSQMMRLIQGDVGSGKTAVALAAAINVIASGDYQVAIMAPLDILANQHFVFIKQVLEKFQIEVALLTGKVKGKARTKCLADIASGKTKIVIGTHALFQEKAIFHNLGLIIIDEQHRFGVNQRLELLSKGCNSDMLMLTATPIPRTLSQIIYADLDVSLIKEKPPGRIPIKTVVTSQKHLDELVQSVTNAIKKGEKIYWLCSTISESEDSEEQNSYLEKPTSVEERYKFLEKLFGQQVGFIHGKLKSAEKEQTLEDFNIGITRLLVATTVIEVGIDVKDATIIIIENAERYGLAQLHQLRGRVGRGSIKSFCILLYSKQASKDSLKRLAVLKDTEDGFLISEEDLKIRGGGDIAGYKQSGLPDFKICNLYFHAHLAADANNLAKKILSEVNYNYESLAQNYKILMEIYNYDQVSTQVSL
jgi:ATP-dependent DNA helicase RecG